MASGCTAAVRQELQGHTQPELGHVEGQHEEPPVGGDADAGDDERPLRGAAEVAVAEHVGDGEPEEGGQADDGVDLAARCRVEVELVDEEEVAEQRCAGAGEAQDGHGHQLVVQRADPQQPGDGGAEEHPGRLLLLGLQVHARRLEDVAALVGPLPGLVQREEGEADRDPDQRDQQPVAPVVGDRHDEGEDQDADRLRQRVRQVVPAEDPSARLGRVGVREVRVVHRVVHPGAHRGGEVEEGEPPDVGRDRHEAAEDGEDEQSHGRHHLAAAPVGPHRQRDGPQQLRHLGDEGHRAERRVGHVERRLEVGADEVDAVAERARDQRRRGQEDQGGVAVALEDAEQRWRLALPGARHDVEVRDDVGVLGLGYRLPQQILWDGEVEQRIVGHRLGTLSLTPASGRMAPPGGRGGDPFTARARRHRRTRGLHHERLPRPTPTPDRPGAALNGSVAPSPR